MPLKAVILLVLFGPVAQLVEQRIENPRVDGSIPSQATKHSESPAKSVGFFFERLVRLHFSNAMTSFKETVCGISSVGRAIPCQGIGREFESLIPLHILARAAAHVAQW
jgi:hypothetical protein